MGTDTQSLKIIGAWLTRFAGLSRAVADKVMTKEAMADLAIMLGKEFPSSAFTSDSLQAVAANHPWFPPYADLRVSVEKWWTEHRPRQRQISGPAGGEVLRGMDAEWFGYYHKRMGEIEAGHAEDAKGVTIDAFGGRGDAGAARRNLASLIRKHSPAAWKIISGGDGSVRGEPTEGEKAAVAASVRVALAALAEAAQGGPKSATFDQQMAAVRASPALKGKTLGALTPEQVKHARETQLGAR